jgi:hypothetical protein
MHWRYDSSMLLMMEVCECNVCHHRWLPRSADVVPRRCASSYCQSVDWNRPRRRAQSRKEPAPQRRIRPRRPPDLNDIELSLPPPCPEAPPPVEMAAPEPGRPRDATVCKYCGLLLINDFARKVHACRP